MSKANRIRIGVGAVALLVVAASLAAGVAAFGESGHGRGANDRDARIAYYGAVKAALSPLLIHVREFPALLTRYTAPDTGAAPASVADTGRALASDFATARDLVRRIPPPQAELGDVYELATVLYVEAARTIELLPTA